MTESSESPQSPVTGGSGGAGGSGGYYGTCFAAGTRIATPAGSVAIERMGIGQEVLAYDVREQRIVVESVTQLHVHTVEAVGALELADERVLHVTGEHPIYLRDEARYERADHVVAGDGLLSLAGESSGAFMTVGAMGFRAGSLAGPVSVYNITVSRTQNYFAEGVLVHNKSGGAGGLGPVPCIETPQAWEGAPFCPSAGCTYFGAATEHVALNAAVNAPEGGPQYALPDGSPPEAGPDEPLALTRAMVCLDEGGTLPNDGYLAFDVEIPDAFAQVALYAEQSACVGSEVGQVWFGDYDAPEPGRWTTQCVQVRPTLLSRAVTVAALSPGTRVANVRAVASCECSRVLKQNTTCGWQDPLGYAGGSACL